MSGTSFSSAASHLIEWGVHLLPMLINKTKEEAMKEAITDHSGQVCLTTHENKYSTHY